MSHILQFWGIHLTFRETWLEFDVVLKGAARFTVMLIKYFVNETMKWCWMKCEILTSIFEKSFYSNFSDVVYNYGFEIRGKRGIYLLT